MTCVPSHWCLLKILFIYFLERGEGREKDRGKAPMCSHLSCIPHWGPGLQPRHVSILGIKQAYLRFAGPHSIHWATLVRAQSLISTSASFPSLLVPFGFFSISLSVAFISSLMLLPIQWVLWASLSPMFWILHIIGYLHFAYFFVEFCSVLSFGPYFFVSIWQPPCVCFCVLGKAALTPCLSTFVKLYGAEP